MAFRYTHPGLRLLNACRTPTIALATTETKEYKNTNASVIVSSENFRLPSSILGSPLKLISRSERATKPPVVARAKIGRSPIVTLHNDLAKRRALARPVEAEGRNVLERLVMQLGMKTHGTVPALGD